MIAVVGAALLLMRSRQQAALSGAWIVRMQRPGQRPYNIRLALEQAGKTLTGQVVYPTGTAAIEEGVVNGTRLSFFTRHTPQFETEPAKISFTGQVRGREVDLTITAPDGGVAKGTARKSE